MSRRFLLILALVALTVGITGCFGSVNEEMVRAVDSNWSQFEPQYRKYTANDPNLPDASKKRRLATIDDFTKLVKQYMDEIEK